MGTGEQLGRRFQGDRSERGCSWGEARALPGGPLGLDRMEEREYRGSRTDRIFICFF